MKLYTIYCLFFLVINNLINCSNFNGVNNQNIQQLILIGSIDSRTGYVVYNPVQEVVFVTQEEMQQFKKIFFTRINGQLYYHF